MSGAASFSTGFEGFVMLLRWLRRDVETSRPIETKDLRWLQWGYMDRGDYSGPYAWYVLLLLPSYLMQDRHYMYDSEPVWHQRALLFKEKLPSGKGGWKMIEIECKKGD